MKLLEERIIRDGRILPGDILKIDSFLNHQIDVRLLDEIGEEFHRLFMDCRPDKILTIEASGIAIATATSRSFGYIPVVFAKKTAASNMSDAVYQASEHSYTRNIDYVIQVAKDYLKEGERILILDDFLANGEAMNAMIEICKMAKAEIAGCGSVVCKTYQSGEQRIKDLGYKVEVLARVKSMTDDGKIEFE
ncbi:MAG: xanthine phosphoribosyltransferase [Erysipelotrichaceae bacterium]|nr:xanthine phosphoribosyltransferase [Erysipelotrichaceae bacterium]